MSLYCIWSGLTFIIKRTGSLARCVSSAEVPSCFSVRVWSFAAPSGEQEPCCYIMNTSWLTGIKPLCLAVWQSLWKVQHHVYGDSHNETSLCLLWSELMAFPLFQGNSYVLVQMGCVCHPAHVFYRRETLFKQDGLRLIHSEN